MNLVLIFVILIMIGVLHYNHLYAQETRPEDFVGASRIEPPSLDSLDFNFSTNAKLIAQEISLYNETEIRDYPLSDLPTEEIKSVFNVLDSGNLSKVLLNMPVNDIKKIQKQLSDDEFNSILKRLPNETSIVIEKNLNYNING